MKKYFKIMLLILACVSLIILQACGDGAENPDTPGEGQDLGDTVPDTPETDTNLRENTPDSLPDNLNFNGADIRILHRQQNDPLHFWSAEIAVESEIGEIVNDAVYRRNRSVEERLNVKITPIAIPGAWDAREDFLRTIRNSVGAGSDDYDLIAGYAYYIPTLAPEGYLYNLNNVEYLEPSAEWWSAACAEEMTIDGKLYYITGDIALTLLRNMFVFYFNKQIVQDHGIENMYQVVLNGDFTVDKVEELTKDMYRDLNGDGKPDGGDAYGFATTTGNHVDVFFNAFDKPIVKKDESGIPQLAMNDTKMIDMVERVYSWFYENENSYAISEYDSGNEELIRTIFAENRALFMAGTVAMSDELRSMDSDYGIIPYPKWNKEQPAYYTASQDSYSLFSILISCTQTDAVGATMEALCAESYRTVTPAYYEIALKHKYSRDDESSQMLDLVRAGVTFDFGTVNSINMENINKIFRELMTDKKYDFTSNYERSERVFQKRLENLVEAYMNLP